MLDLGGETGASTGREPSQDKFEAVHRPTQKWPTQKWPTQKSTYLRFKRAFDIVVSLILLLITVPVLLGLALAVATNLDGGPIIYRQRRIGRSGRAFECLKFRSMYADADAKLSEMLEHNPALRAEWDVAHKLQIDPRVTSVGKLLRSTSLDELPQLWNVLVGDMSIVGPRPITQAEVDGPYQTYGGRQDYLSVRPGITGLWQVSGRSAVSYPTRIALDRDYVRNISLRGDATILVRTIAAVMRRSGAC